MATSKSRVDSTCPPGRAPKHWNPITSTWRLDPFLKESNLSHFFLKVPVLCPRIYIKHLIVLLETWVQTSTLACGNVPSVRLPNYSAILKARWYSSQCICETVCRHLWLSWLRVLRWSPVGWGQACCQMLFYRNMTLMLSNSIRYPGQPDQRVTESQISIDLSLRHPDLGKQSLGVWTTLPHYPHSKSTVYTNRWRANYTKAKLSGE